MAATEALIDPAEIMANYEGSGLLDLSNQGLHKLDPKCVCGAAHTLILDQNHIMKLELLEHSQALQQLSVASNRLVRMMAVSKLTNLRVLNLPNNSIGYIEGLKDLLLLQWLNLAGNNIKVIEQLHNCASLQHLDLSDNNISHIGDLTQLSALKTLLLHGNMITSLRTAPAHLPPSLTVLSLAENEIRDLTEVSYLAPLPVLEQLSVMSNPCVMAAPSLPSCDYRPYVVSWCLKLKLLDGQAVSQKEGLKAEWLYSQGKGRAFRPGQHAQLVQYLALTCPLTATPGLQSAEDAKLERVLNKQRQHQRQLQKSRLCCSQSPSRPTHLDVQQWQNHRSREEEEEEEEENKEEDEEQEEEEAIPRKDMDPAVQVNVWLGSGSVVPVLRLPPAAEDGLILEDVDEEKLHGSLLSSDSAYLPFNPAVYPASAPDSGEEEFEDSLAPPTSAQPRLSETESMSGADLAAGGAGKLEVESVGGADFAADGAAGSEAESADGAAGSEAESVARSERLGQVLILSGSESCKWTRSLAVKRCEPHDAAVRIQAWWRGHYTRHCHPQAREVRAEIRLRRMQDHILHLTTELDRVRKQQEEDRLQRRVQEEALKFLWKQLQAVLEWQSSVSSALTPPAAAAAIRTESSIPESGLGLESAGLNSGGLGLGSPETERSLRPGPATGDGSLLEQYLCSVQRMEEKEEEEEEEEQR